MKLLKGSSNGSWVVKKYPILFIVLFSAIKLVGQENGEIPTIMSSTSFKSQNVIPPSPEAAGLGRFGNLPVSLFTGTPQIGIPLYNLKGNSLSLPIQLSYNAGGFNPQDVAGWAGYEWNLNAGGVITRSVVGNPDIASNYFKSPSPLVVPSGPDLIAYNDYLENLRKGYLEAQPDMYYFNFGNFSGKFMIQPDGTVMMLEKNNLLITHCINSCSPETSSITITDPSGTIYNFTSVEISTTTTDDASTDVPVWQGTYASSWFLTSIISADNNETIVFDYYGLTQEHYPYTYAAVNQSKVYEFTLNTTNNLPSISYVTSNPPVTAIKRKYLQKITLRRSGQDVAYVQFTSSVDQRQDLGHSTGQFPGERLLNDIQVYSRALDLSFKKLKQFNFSFSYFTNSTYPSDWKYKRLRLDQLQEVSVDVGTTSPPPHIFEYDNSLSTPPIGTAGIDHWGFYNEGNSFTTTPASDYINGNVVINASNRLSTLTGAKSLMLSKIKYPTGGYTSFEYELHNAVVENIGVINVGGIRIKRMIDYSAENQKAVEKTYEYTLENGGTSGKAKYPSYKNISTYTRYGQQLGGYFDPCYGTIDMQKQTITVAGTSVMGLGSIMGGHIGYSRVVEKQVDINTGQPLGKTVYEYETSGNWGEMNNEDGKNGELLKQTVYDNANKIIKADENVFDDLPGAGITITSISVFTNPDQDSKVSLFKTNHTATNTIGYGWLFSSLCLESGYTIVDGRLLKVKTFPYGIYYGTRNRKLIQQTSKTYDQVSNSYMTSIKKLTYSNTQHSFPTAIEQTTNNNESVVTYTKYPQDYTITTANDAAIAGILQLKNKNIIGAGIEVYQYRQNSNGTNKRYVGGSITQFGSAVPYPVSLWSIETSEPLTTFQESAVSGGLFSQHSNYKQMGSLQYDGSGLLVQQTKTNDLSSAYVWAYHGNLPIAEAINATAASIAYSSFETNEGGNWTSSTGFDLNRNPNDGLTGYFSFSVAASTISKSNLPSQKYIVSYWSKNGALAISPTQSASKTGLTVGAFTYYEHLLPNTTSVSLQGSATIDELRLYPEKAMMSTSTYNYYTGQISSQCTPANKITKFEYDGLQRLVNIKDEAGNIVKNYRYNYGTVNTTAASAQTLFYSAYTQAVFYKQGCPSGSEAQPYTYIVPYGKYVSVNNPTEANNKASAEITANGQSAANQNGLCYFWNTEQKKRFFRNNCQPSEGNGMAYWYTIPAHTYWSTTSVTNANDKAWVDINANGQTAANTMGNCSCTMEGLRFVNGTCEQGQISYVGYEYAPDCSPGMNYRCYFKYIFSDGYQTPVYSMCNATPCQNY